MPQSPLAHIALWILSSQGLSMVGQLYDRQDKYQKALAAARAQGKPLLVVGKPNLPWNHPCGDVCLDLSPTVLLQCPAHGVVADVRAIPFPDNYFGAACAQHVLEHLPSPEDLEAAWQELWRVADEVFVAAPQKSNILAWLVPDHFWWLHQEEDGTMYAEPRWDRIRARQEGRI